MISPRGLCTALLGLALAAGVGAAETIAAGPFAVDVSPTLTVRLRGMLLITGDRCAGFRGTVADAPVLVEGGKGEVFRQGQILTTLARQGRNSLRREVMVTADAVHISFELRAFGPTGGSHVEYDLLSPVAALDQVPLTITTGAPRSHRADREAVLNSPQTKAGEYALREVVHARFAFPGGACSMDFNPQGAWQGESNYGESMATTPWHDGKLWHFMVLCSGGRFGATMTGKIILRAGDIPYEQLHSRRPVTYDGDFPVALALNFSATDQDGHFAACGAQAPADKPYRWRDPAAVRIVARKEGGFLYRDYAAPARPAAEGVFELTLPSGLYLLTLYSHDAQAATGPFTVAGPEGPLCRDVRLPRGEHWIKTVPLRSREGRTSLRFSGDWKVNGFTVQEILGDAEDFLFDRPFWNAALPPAQ